MFGFATKVALFGGTIARIPSFYIQGKRLEIAIWKQLIITAVLTICELAGTMILFRIENGAFGGMSYFGGILLLPLFCIPLALVFRVAYFDLMDMVATGTGGMLAVMRIQCLYYGCCAGTVLFTTGSGYEVRFPSRVVEILAVMLITIALLKIGNKEKYKGLLYPIYLVCYGVIRFLINWFRDGAEPFVWILPAGNFWSVVSVLIGLAWIAMYVFLKRKSPIWRKS